MKVGKPIKYLAVPPAEVVERVQKKVLEEADLQTKVLSELKTSDVLSELNTLHVEGVKLVDPTDRSGAFRGRDKTHEHVTSMVKNAKTSITLMLSKQGAERKYNLLANHLRRAAKRGVDVKVAVPIGTPKDIVEGFSVVGKVQTHKNKDARFCLVDNSEILLFLTDDNKVHKSYDCAVWVEAPHFVSYFASLFANEWKK